MDAQAAADLLRRIRHDFGNHLQVILGYIDLGKLEQAREYIQEIVCETMLERKIFEDCDAAAGLYFYQQLLAARDLGIILRYKGIEIESLDTVTERQEPLRSLHKLFAIDENRWRYDEEPLVELSIREMGGIIEMLFECDDLDKNPLRIRIEE